MAMDSVSNLDTARGLGNVRAPPWRALLHARRFLPLLIAQSLAALDAGLLARVIAGQTSSGLDTLAVGAALVPVWLCWAIVDRVADRFAVDRSVRVLKALEILVMGGVAAGIVLQSRALLLVTVVLMSLLVTMFAALKHAFLARNLHHDEFVTGFALLAVGTVAATLAGFRAGNWISAESGPGVWMLLGCLLPAIAGFAASMWIPATPAADPGLALSCRPVTTISRQIAICRDERLLGIAVAGMAWSWFVLAAVLLATEGVSASPVVTEPPLNVLIVALLGGVSVGCLLGDRLCDGYADIGLFPLSALGQALLALDLVLLAQTGAFALWRVICDLFLLGACSGSAYPMLLALVLSRGDVMHRAHSALLGLVVSTASVGLACVIGASLLDPGVLLAFVAAGALGVAAFAYRRDAHRTLRFLTWLLIHAFYRVEKKDFEHIPSTGPAVLVCNHVSFVDSVIIMAAVRRPIRFVMDHRIHQTPVVGFLFRHSRTIPIATAKEDPAMKESAFAAVASALRNGELIGLFPEGRITHTGEINHFRYGVGRIVEETPVPVVPMALRGLWGSFFSRRYGPAMSKPQLMRWLAKVELVVGEAVSPEKGTPEYLQEVVTELRGGMV